MATELGLQRIYDDGNTTEGYLLETSPKRIMFGFTCEDEQRKVKVKHETRIKAGRYKLGLNKWVDVKGNPTPLTQHYRSKYDWFKWHIEILNVEGFVGVYIHIGNNEKNTDGCVLLGVTANTLNKDLYQGNSILNSTIAYKYFYLYIVEKLEKGEEVFLTICDEPL